MKLIDLALLVCPREFRTEYAASVSDVAADSDQYLSAVWDTARTGLVLHMQGLNRNFLAGIRGMKRAPLLSAVAMLTVTIAVAANLVITALVANVLLQPLPYDMPERLLFVQETPNGRSLTYPDATSLNERVGSYARVSLASSESATLLGSGRPQDLVGARVSANYFDVLREAPTVGRLFRSNDPPTNGIVIAYDLWSTRFARSASVIGRAVRLGDHAYEIVGVTRSGFRDPTPFGLVERSYWLPIDTRDRQQIAPSNYSYTAVARLADNVNPVSGKRTLEKQLFQVVVDRTHKRPCCISVTQMSADLLGPVQRTLWTLYALVTAVLLLACINIANLQLTRNTARDSELAIRASVGATKTDLARDAVSETLLISIVGCVAGIILAQVTIFVFRDIGAQLVPRWEQVSLGGGVLVYAVLLVPLIAIVSGLFPALSQRPNLVKLLGSSHASDSRSSKLARSFLVILEVAIATALVISAGLVIRSFMAYTDVEMGFRPDNLFEIKQSNPTSRRYQTTAEQLAFLRNVSLRLQALPGVVGVSGALQVPFDCCASTRFTVPGKIQKPTPTMYNAVDPNYFTTMGIGLSRGRLFTNRDRSESACVVIVDDVFARKYFGSPDGAIGKRLLPELSEKSACEVVGTVGDVRDEFEMPPQPMLYLPLQQDPEFSAVVVRTNGRVDNLSASASNAISDADPEIAAPSVYSFQSLFDADALSQRTAALIFSCLAAIALVLALSGIYAVTSYSVARRTYEFGIRRAVGASAGNLVVGVLFSAIGQAARGTALGVILALIASQGLGELLYQVSAFDVTTFLLSIVIVLACSSVAAIVPAIRAARTDLAIALRNT